MSIWLAVIFLVIYIAAVGLALAGALALDARIDWEERE